MNILILNWRDIKNPSGGGAEILTHEIATRFVQKGYSVTQFSSLFRNAKKIEQIDEVTFIRKGKWWTVHFWAFIYYIKNRNKFDVIIDEVHWFPFFAALYAPKKTVALTCEVATKLFFTLFPKPFVYIFIFIEKIYFYLYKNVPTLVISESTFQDLIKSGHSKNNLQILPMGITYPKNIKLLPKELVPTLITVGRLNLQKGILDVIEAFAYIHQKIPSSVLWLVGSGEKQFLQKINDLLKHYSLAKSVKLWGFVSEIEKFTLLSKSHLLISASQQEGWGLTIPEAGLMKTPAVVYNIEGFRDIIKQNKTGVLVENSSKVLGEQVIKVLQNKKFYDKLTAAAFADAKQYSWDNTMNIADNFIRKYCKNG